VQPGLVLTPGLGLDALDWAIANRLILIMSVNPGFAYRASSIRGAPSLRKIEQARKRSSQSSATSALSHGGIRWTHLTRGQRPVADTFVDVIALFKCEGLCRRESPRCDESLASHAAEALYRLLTTCLTHRLRRDEA